MLGKRESFCNKLTLVLLKSSVVVLILFVFASLFSPNPPLGSRAPWPPPGLLKGTSYGPPGPTRTPLISEYPGLLRKGLFDKPGPTKSPSSMSGLNPWFKGLLKGGLFGPNSPGLTPSGRSPSGLSPSGLSPSGLNSFGLSPSGLSSSGLIPSGLRPPGPIPSGRPKKEGPFGPSYGPSGPTRTPFSGEFIGLLGIRPPEIPPCLL